MSLELSRGIDRNPASLDGSCNSVGHILRDIAKEDASNNGTTSECNTDEPDVFQTFSISPSASHRCSLQDCWGHARYSCELFRSRKVYSHKLGRVSNWQASFDREFADVSWQSWCQAFDEDIAAALSVETP